MATSSRAEGMNVEATQACLTAIERGAAGAALAGFTPDVVQQEFANRLVPNGMTRNLRQDPRVPRRQDRAAAQLRLFRSLVIALARSG